MIASSIDALHRFHFERMAVRGAIVHVGAGWQQWLTPRDYPPAVRDLLGRALAAAPLLASTLKFRGRIHLQMESGGPVTLLLVQIGHNMEVRGMARHKDVRGPADLSELAPGGRLAITIENEASGQRYQGHVPLVGETLAESLESYFERSEQLSTWLRLVANSECLSGFMLQRLPGEGTEADWEHVCALADTLGDEELLSSDAHTLLRRLYHSDRVRLDTPQTVSVRCRCTEGRMGRMLVALGREEVDDILNEQGRVEIECNFCGRTATYGADDVQRLFETADREPPSELRH